MSLKDELQAAMTAKDYPAAIGIIQRSKLPEDEKQRRVAMLLERMKQETRAEAVKAEPVRDAIPRGPEKTVKPLPGTEGAPVKAKRAGGCARALRLVVFALIVIPVIFAIGHAVNSYMNRYQWRMEDVCRTVYRDDWLDNTFTFGQWYYGCQSAASHAIDLYGDEVRYCYDTSNQTDKNFMQCLVDQDVTLNRGYLSEIPK